ncbi:FAD-dependent oxidoreductase [Fodinicola feengrottensis]|uniref:FAD-dependent oxidoreductase n=1 Tax=Fodinicola feengrottensis TaxID=435914 RepID=A0ABN2JC06_9ACTN
MTTVRPITTARARCVVVGGGPGGLLLAYLLARADIPVTLLEAHRDFDRRFRGDSLHPYTLELLDQLGLADELLELPHYAARTFRMHTPGGTLTAADYSRLPTRFNYVALMPQAIFLDFLAAKAVDLPSMRLRLGAKATGLVEENGIITGVRYQDSHGEHVLRSAVVIGADGRFSRVRRLAGLPDQSLGAANDLLWFRLPRRASDPPEADVDIYFGPHNYVGLLGGQRDWQVGYTLPKGGYAAARQAGLGPIRDFFAEHVPWLADRLYLLSDFGQTTLLSVDISRVERWHRPGLMLLGDAAHVISPVGGNGILMAIQDAVAAANRLVPALRTGRVDETVLAAVQAEREPAIRAVQARQVRVERRVMNARERGLPITPPQFLRMLTSVPAVRVRAARANAYGPRPPVLDPAVLTSSKVEVTT